MQKIKELLSKKPQGKTKNHKQIIQNQKKQFLEDKSKQENAQKQQFQKRMKKLDDYYSQKKKMIKPNQLTIQNQDAQILESKQKIALGLQRKNASNRINNQYQLQQLKKEKIIQNKANDHEFERKLKQVEQYQELDVKYRSRIIEPRLMDDESLLVKKVNMIKEQKDIPYQQICDSIYLWISKLLKDWYDTLEQKYRTAEEKLKGKPNMAKFAQSSKDLNNFLKVLKGRGGDKQMVTSIYHIMNCCLVRQYVEANNKYIQLSIGSAPWPMGVAMLGITVKKNSQRLSHVLNQQMTRRWMQSIKRLISLSQQLYPNQDHLKMVLYSVKQLI